MKIVAFSDTHGRLPAVETIPACDLLVIAGDLSPAPSGEFDTVVSYLDKRLRSWLDEVPAKRVVAIAGNHDHIFQHRPQMVPAGLRWDYLEDRAITINGLRIWGTPWTPRFFDWAFMKDEPGLLAIYRRIPEGIDILVCHGPARGVCDVGAGCPSENHSGSRALRMELERIKPRLHIFGHIHTGTHGGVILPEGTIAYNVSICDDRNWLVYPVTVIEI